MRNRKDIEKIIKGFANHRRIEILLLLEEESGLSVSEISERCKSGFQNIAQHTAKLYAAGLVYKNRDLNMVRHSLTPLGKKALRFVKLL